LKRRARELGIPFKEAVSRAIRAGLGEVAAARRHPAPKTIPHSLGFGPGVDLDKLGQLAASWRRRLSHNICMILPDVNVPFHTHNVASSAHERARLWWDVYLAGAEVIGLACAIMPDFVRITTNRKVVAQPAPVQDVMKRPQSRCAYPHLEIHPSLPD
jgi:hypothetical protein